MSIIRKASTAFVNWCADNSPAAKFERTVFQGILGVICAVISYCTDVMPMWFTIGIAPVIMAIVAPIQGEIGKKQAEDDTSQEA